MANLTIKSAIYGLYPAQQGTARMANLTIKSAIYGLYPAQQGTARMANLVINLPSTGFILRSRAI
jgi:hypothetical protein